MTYNRDMTDKNTVWLRSHSLKRPTKGTARCVHCPKDQRGAPPLVGIVSNINGGPLFGIVSKTNGGPWPRRHCLKTSETHRVSPARRLVSCKHRLGQIWSVVHIRDTRRDHFQSTRRLGDQVSPQASLSVINRHQTSHQASSNVASVNNKPSSIISVTGVTLVTEEQIKQKQSHL